MKTLRLSAASLGILSAILFLDSVRAAIPVPYHAGRYVGSMQIITTDASDPFVRTTATIKLRGRSDGSKTLRLVGTPQTAMPVLPNTDDFPMKVFVLEEGPSSGEGAVYLAETPAMDTDGTGAFSRTVESQTVTPSSIVARVTYQRTFANVTFDVQVIIRLKRITP